MYLESGGVAECKDFMGKVFCARYWGTGDCKLSGSSLLCAETCEFCSGKLRKDNSLKSDNKEITLRIL